MPSASHPVRPPAVTGGHVIAIGNLKGGTGNSTVSVNLACALAAQGRRTVIVDNDPQGTAASWAEQDRLPVVCEHRPLESFAQVECWIRGVQGLRASHDAVLIDLPASVAPALAASFLMATVILVPTSPSEIGLRAARQVLVHIRRTRAERGGSPPAVLIVPDRVVDLERGLDGPVDRLAGLGEPVAPLRHSVLIDLAFERGEWVGSFRPGSAAHGEVEVLAGLVGRRLDALPPSAWPAGAGAADPVRNLTSAAGSADYVEKWRGAVDLRPTGWRERLLGLRARWRQAVESMA
jgi:chromosome partitioning protein